jgi:CubicO group peptidase (beta-lactamase class C family)
VMETEIALADKATVGYQNVNYALLRILVASLDGYAGWANDPAAGTAARFITYVNKRVFSPLGIQDVEYRPEANGTLFYPFPTGPEHGTAYGDWSLTAGPAGSQLSAHELALFIAALFDGMLLAPSMLTELWNGVGLTDDYSRSLGVLPDGSICRGKGGFFPGDRNGGAELRSALFHCSNGVSGMLLINGEVAPGQTFMDALSQAFSPQP